MTATVTVSESNTGSETITASITNTNMGSNDSVNLDPATYPITAGTNSFEKWQRFNVQAMGGSTKVKNLKVWASGALASAATHYTNATTSSYGGASTFNTPSATDRSATYGYTKTMPVSQPASANLGIAGTLAGELTTTGYSDYLIQQIQTTASATAGTTVTMNYQYDEIA